jgi:hypothetical protein
MTKILNNKSFVIVYRALALTVALLGLFDITGLIRGKFIPVILLAYTIQSNILVAVLMGVLLFLTIKAKPTGENKQFGFYPRISAFVALAIFVTMLVFWVLLVPSFENTTFLSLMRFDNLAVHLITPLLMLGDYLMFTKRGLLRAKDLLLCTIIPYCYLVEALTLGLTKAVHYGAIGIKSHYPYFFLDIDQQGGAVFLYVMGLTAFFIGLFYLWFLVDRRFGKNKKY